MISLEEAQARLLALASPLPVETLGLLEAAGRWAAEPIVALRTQPSADLSAMDGYAVAHNGCPGPWRVIGESAAGRGFAGVCGASEAVRIFTGAPLPQGADTIIMQEDVIRAGDQISICAELSLPFGQHVRRAGGDFTAGSVLIAAGERMTPARIALAAMGGHGAVAVRRVPKVEIMSTGDELVPPGTAMGADQIPNSNAVMLTALLRDDPCMVTSGAIIPDRLDALTSAIRASTADILVTCGGASVGDHDLVRPALIESGAEIDFWKIAMRPGKPLMAGRRGPQIVLGLPGNPVSAYVTATLFLRPLIAALGGAEKPIPRRFQARLSGNLAANGPRTDHVRARWVDGRVQATGLNDSAALAALARSDILIIRPPDAGPAQDGDEVDVMDIA